MKTSKEGIIEVPVVPPKGASREERKEFLQESANKYLEAIETQLGDLKKVGKNALIIGGVIVAAYAITELLLPSNKVKTLPTPKPIAEEDDENEDSFVWDALKGVATSVLLTIAKNKLLEIIDSYTTESTENVGTNS
ncbi:MULTISPECIES: hypothetical protein [Emticicia]|uniref:hypothetical protein n=1 Tax=Emticicia TaxID=312278 RepID=UPI0007D8B9F8|nr:MULTISPECIES: hypothetical protein [Emticicia]